HSKPNPGPTYDPHIWMRGSTLLECENMRFFLFIFRNTNGAYRASEFQSGGGIGRNKNNNRFIAAKKCAHIMDMEKLQSEMTSLIFSDYNLITFYEYRIQCFCKRQDKRQVCLRICEYVKVYI